VKKDDFQRLRVRVGIQREMAKDAERMKIRMEKEAKLELMKKGVQGDIDAAAKLAKDAGELVDKVHTATTEAFNKGVKNEVAQMLKEADEMDKQVEEAKESLTKAKEAVAGLLTDVDEDLKQWLTLRVTTISSTVSASERKQAKSAGSVVRLRDSAKRKEILESDAAEAKALSFLRYHQKQEKLSMNDLFKTLDINKDGQISDEEFVKFFGACKRPPKPKGKGDDDGEEELETAPADEGLRKVFKSLDGDGAGFLTSERFAYVVRHLMKVCTVTVLSSELKADSAATRKLERGEIVEVLDGPFEDESSKTKRVKVSAMRDSAEGYATMVGNTGSLVLRDGGRLFKVLRETPMTDKFELEEAPPKEKEEKPTEPVPPAGAVKDDARKLKAGELVEVIEYPKKEEKSGSMRMKCKAKSDGHVGYATCQGNTGAVFMDCV